MNNKDFLMHHTLEEVLKSSSDPTDKKYIELKNKAELIFDNVKSHISNISDKYYFHTKNAADRANNYVHENPWQGIGAGMTLGLLIGLIISPR
ncbi:glycine zipper domain-containing protein [Candidatus Ishikawella capsulata]